MNTELWVEVAGDDDGSDDAAAANGFVIGEAKLARHALASLARYRELDTYDGLCMTAMRISDAEQLLIGCGC